MQHRTTIAYMKPPDLPSLSIYLAASHGVVIFLMIASSVLRCASDRNSTGARALVFLIIYPPVHRFNLPASLEARFFVYDHLGLIKPRMLLPSKVRQFPVIETDASLASDTNQADLLPACVGVDEVSSLVSVW